jgi:hypothetical protein
MTEKTEIPQPKLDKKHIAEAFQVNPEITARPEVRVVGQHTAVGEYHVRLQDDETANQMMENVLKFADVVMVEFDSKTSGYENSTEHKRFMSMAQDSSQGKELIILDNSRPSGFDTWKKAGIKIEFNDYMGLVALDCAQNPVMGIILSPNKQEINQEDVTKEIADSIVKKIPDIDLALAQRLAEGAKRTIMMSASFGEGKIFKLIDKYLRVDSFAREVVYQQLIAEQVKLADKKRIVAVVGVSHLKGVEEALQGKFDHREVKEEVLKEFDDVYGLVTMTMG